MEKIKKSRIEYIDLLEASAILFVVLYHTRDYTYNFLEGEKGLLLYVPYFFRAVLSTCVPLFFFANGFLLLNKKFDLKKHIIKSIRLVVLTFIWGGIDILIIMCIKDDPLTVKEFFKALWSWKLGWINYLWYMGALICIYVFFPLIKVVYDNNRKVFYYFVIITAIFTFGNKALNLAGSIAAYIWNGRTDILTFNWFNIFNPYRNIYGYAFVYFCVGGCCNDALKIIQKYRKKINIAASIILIVSTLILCLIGVAISKIIGEVWDVTWNGYDTIFTFINVVSIFVLTTNYQGHCRKIKNIISLISCNTLGIYFVHEVYKHCLRTYMGEDFMFTGGDVIMGVLVLVLSLFTTILIKKIPLLKHLL